MARPVVVNFVGDAAKLTGTIHGVEGRMSKLKRSLIGLGIGAAIFTGTKDAIKAGVDLNETTNKLGLAFGRNAQDIQAWAQGSAKNMGLPKQAAEENAASFGLLFSKLGLTGDATAQMSKGMVQLAVDLGSVHNADPTQILEAQQAAFRGEYDALQRFVPAISAAAVQTEALKETGKRNAKELTNQEKATATYNLMLQQTKAEQGDFARTSDQAANKSKINAARVADLSANIGTLLLPAVTAATNLLGHLADFMERNKTAGTLLGAAVLGLTALVLANTAITKAWAAVQGLATVATKAAAVAMRVLNVVMKANTIGLVVTAIALLVVGLIAAYRHSATFRRIVQTAFHAVQAAAEGMWHVIQSVFGWIRGHWPLLLAVLVGPVGAAVIAIVRNWGKIKAGAVAAWNGVVALARGIPGRIVRAVGNLGRLLYQAGRNIVQGLIDGIRSMISAVGDAIGAVAGKIRDFLPFSPAREGPLSGAGSPFVGGQNIARMVGQGLLAGRGAVGAGMGGLLAGGLGARGGGIDYDKLARAIASELRANPPVVRVDDVHTGLLGKRNRLRLGLGLG